MSKLLVVGAILLVLVPAVVAWCSALAQQRKRLTHERREPAERLWPD